ncbi:hypothetical protein TrRE_jg12978 [Triparma retinervis]|uniref:Uncharacterized protein n=1 Tax=Triparma retinervis TaxID=2557542 RepID=A0A9W7E7X9_9STRA|nr:hypothetical protein TrRE_jg12978 [Triparma retinervis]
MKLFSLFIVFLGASANLTDKSQCSTECVEDGSVDYFPDKASFDHSTCLRMEYFNTYKVSYLDCGSGDIPETIVYVQCGCTAPTTINANATITVPAGDFGIQSTSHIPYVHYLGLLDQMVLEIEFSSSLYPYTFTDNCHKDNVESGVTKQRKQSGTPGLLGLDTSEDGVEFVFHEGYNPKGNLTNPITCTEWLEKDLVAQTEWIKFFALPFNKEREANEIFDQIKGTMDCIGANTDTFSSLYSTDYKALTVMTAAYSEWSEGWVVSADCEVKVDWYCTLFEDLGVTKVGNVGVL